MHTNPQDTITALSTSPGLGAIAVIRISGSQSFVILRKIFDGKLPENIKSHRVHYGNLMDGEQILDEVVVSVFKGPNSFTGEDTVEISCHGSVYIQQKIIELILRSGARMAKQGEFTMRAFMNGKMDLSQAEAVADLIATESEASHAMAMKQMRGGFSEEINALREKLIHFASLIELELDFSEEDVEFADRQDLKDLVSEIQRVCKNLIDSFETGNVIKNGVAVTIAGAPNVGKSTLLNRLLNEDRALVSDIAGTTRDVIEERISIGGIQFRFIDTAGIRKTSDIIESMGIEKTYEKVNQAHIVVYLTDAASFLNGKFEDEILSFENQLENPNSKILLAINKIDQVEWDSDVSHSNQSAHHTIAISAKDGHGIEDLKNALINYVNIGDVKNQVIVNNVRHLEALNNAYGSLLEVQTGLGNDITGDFLAIDIRKALHHLGEITGEISTDDLLGNIFSKFCIGK